MTCFFLTSLYSKLGKIKINTYTFVYIDQSKK